MDRVLYRLPHGVELSCRVSGVKGRPLLLFLHGFPEGAFVWDHLLDHFSKQEHGGYRCVAPNMRGFEQSSSPLEARDYRVKFLLQDMAALIDIEGGQAQCVVAHDWGGAVAWSLANQMPKLVQQLVIINSPHPGTFLRELKHSASQQAASAYMNFLVRPDAEALLTQNDYERLWPFFVGMGAQDGPYAWLTEAVKQQYRELWQHGLTGGCNYYRASPLRPAQAHDPAAMAVTLPTELLTVTCPTLVIWGLGDIALPAALIDGLDAYVPNLIIRTVTDGTHWLIHEQPERVIQYVDDFLRRLI